VSLRTILVVAAAVLLAGCGAQQRPPAPAQVDEGRWLDASSRLLDRMADAVSRTADAGATAAEAASSLRDVSLLYDQLVAYTFLDECAISVRNLGTPPPRLAGVERALTAACAPLEAAAGLFTEAASRDDGQTLLRASRRARSAVALLAAARAEMRGHGS
jgi:hypothetical protein